MMHYSCDLCHRPLDSRDDLRYVVKLEVYAAFDPLQIDEADCDRDNLQELGDILERLDDAAAVDVGDDVYQQLRFDLCPDCRARFLKNPLGRKNSEQFDFSKN